MQMIEVKGTVEKSRSIGAWVSMFALLIAPVGSASVAVGHCFEDVPPKKTYHEALDRTEAAGAPPAVITKGMIKGRIINVETGKPVEGVRVRILMDPFSGAPSWLEPVTDKDGQYSQQAPFGEVTPYGVIAPFGYYFQQPTVFDLLLLTKNEPVIVRNYSLSTGTPWKVELANFRGSRDRPPFLTWLTESLPANTFGTKDAGMVVANAQGEAVLTIPPDRKEYVFRCDQRERPSRYEIPDVQLLMDKGFDPARIQGVPECVAGTDSVRLKDYGGNTATLCGAEVVIRSGEAIIRFPCKSIPASRGFKAIGTIQDERGKPITGAKVTAAFINNNNWSLCHISDLVANSSVDGKFIMPEVLLPAHYFSDRYQIQMVVRKSGRSALETKPVDLLEVQKTKVADFGIIALQPGKTLKGQVVDVAGKVIEGAVISFRTDGFVSGHPTCRSNAEGRFQIPELAYGKINLRASYGDREAHEEVTFDANSGEFKLTVYRRRN
jgi:hypothetical protein